MNYFESMPKPMAQADMKEIIPTLPSVMSRLPILFDETGAERVVGWYKYSNGTKKPVYEKNIKDTTPSTSNTAKDFATISSVDKVISIDGTYEQNDNYVTPVPDYSSTNDTVQVGYYLNKNNLSVYVKNTGTNRLDKSCYLTIRYTKSTDTAQ